MSCLPPVKGIPYDFDGSLSLESRYIILAQYVCEMKKAIDEHMTDWFSEWVKENLDNIFGEIMYEQSTETLKFSINNIINAIHSVSDGQLKIMEATDYGRC